MSVERRGPAICNASNIKEGKDEMIKASIDLQDLRRRIYVKAKAEPSWRFWGLYVHVCKMETLRAAYPLIGSLTRLLAGTQTGLLGSRGNLPYRAVSTHLGTMGE